MATYKELVAQKAKLEEQIETARAKELEAVIQQVRQTVAEYGLTAEDLGLAQRRGRRAGAKAPVPAKYRDPKTGATWSGRGRAPAWIGKNRDKFLIACFVRPCLTRKCSNANGPPARWAICVAARDERSCIRKA